MIKHAPSPAPDLASEPHQERGNRLKKSGSLIEFSLSNCFLGNILVARNERGICAISLGDEQASLVEELRGRFPSAELAGGDLERFADEVVAFIDAPARGLDLPLDIRGTAFQIRVWELLQKIPVGQTLSYREVAQRLGAPKAVRAVAGACAANTLAVAIPCHRVVRSNGELSGYRWGLERKRALLEREQVPLRKTQSA